MLSQSSIFTGPVSRHGRLQAKGNRLVDKRGRPVSLAGMSLFWGNDGWSGEKFWNPSVIGHLKRDWNVSVIRASMGVEDPGGYVDNPEGNLHKLKTVVDACIASDLYVIIDWHSHDAQLNQPLAEAFFAEISRTYAGREHVIYEIWNEPRYVTWAETVKPYSEAVIAAIRAHDKTNLIVVGSADWSTEVDVAAADPVDDINAAYSFHFYAASHMQKKRLQAQKALDLGKALFVTEWGCCESTGNGKIDEESTREWLRWMKKNGISHCNWALNDKEEAASALRPGCDPFGLWEEADLTPSGKLVREAIRSWGVEKAKKPPVRRLELAPI